jgi:hypothetical protein
VRGPVLFYSLPEQEPKGLLEVQSRSPLVRDLMLRLAAVLLR